MYSRWKLNIGPKVTPYTWDKELLNEDPERADESPKGQSKPHKEPGPSPLPPQTALRVRISCHLPRGHRIDPSNTTSYIIRQVNVW